MLSAPTPTPATLPADTAPLLRTIVETAMRWGWRVRCRLALIALAAGLLVGIAGPTLAQGTAEADALSAR